MNEECVCNTLYISVEHCVRMVLTVEDRPSSTRLSRWVCVSVSISSLVCSRVLLSIRAKHLHTQALTYTLVSDENVNRLIVRGEKGVIRGQQSKRCSGSFQTDRYAFILRHWQQGLTKWQFELLICLYLSRNWRTKSSNSADAKHRLFSIWDGEI